MLSLKACLAALVPVLITVTLAPAQAKDTLVVAGFGGSMEKLFREQFIPPFEKANDVEIQYVAGNSSDTVAKLLAQKNNQQIDVALIDDGPMAQAVELGLCALIENYDDSQFVAVAPFPGHKASGFGTLATGIVYNTKIFAEKGWAAPTSWADLKDPKYKNAMVIPALSTGYGVQTLLMLAKVSGGGVDNMDPGFAAAKVVAPNVVAFEPSMAKMSEMFQTGEVSIGTWGSPRFQALADTGFPVAFVYPAEGAPVTMSAICPVAKPKISPKAQAYVAMMLSAPAQKLLADTVGFAPVRKGVEVSKPGVMPIGPLADKLVSFDWTILNAKRDDWSKRFSREVER